MGDWESCCGTAHAARHPIARFMYASTVPAGLGCCGKQRAFDVTPKVHKLQHVPMVCEFVNMRFIQCYLEESAVGTTTRIWMKSMAGRWRRRVQRTVLAKRFLGLFLRFEG